MKDWPKGLIIIILLLIVSSIVSIIIVAAFQLWELLPNILTLVGVIFGFPSVIIVNDLNAQEQKELEERKIKYSAKLTSFNKVIDCLTELISLTNQKYSVEVLKENLLASKSLNNDDRQILICLLTTARDVEKDLGTTIIANWIKDNPVELDAKQGKKRGMEDLVTLSSGLDTISLLYLRKYQTLANTLIKASSESSLVFSNPDKIQKTINDYATHLRQTWKLMPIPSGEKLEIDSLGRNVGLDKGYLDILSAMKEDLDLTMS